MTLAATIAELWHASGNESPTEGFSRSPIDPTAHVVKHTDEASSANQDLVARVRAGDRAAFDMVVLETFPLLARVAARLVGSAADGEEIAQDVLVRLWVKRASLPEATPLTVYLLGAIRHRALNVLRDRRTAERHLADAAPGYTSIPLPDADVVAHERHVHVSRALAALVPRHRLAVELRYGAQASYAEIGAALGVSDRAAEQIVRRAIVALRRVLGNIDL